jgi:hypothetical protein
LYLRRRNGTVVVWDIPQRLILQKKKSAELKNHPNETNEKLKNERNEKQRKEKRTMSVTLVKEYDAHLDMKKRVTLRGAEAEYYAVRMFEDGHIVLEPRVLVPPDMISKRTLKMLDKASTNFKKGKVSKPIDLDRYL